MSDLIDNAQNVRRWLDEKGQHEKGQHEKADAVSALVIAYQTLKNAKPAEQQEATCKQSLQVAAEDKAGGDEPVAWMREGWGPDCGPYVEFYRDDEMGWRDRKEWTPLFTRPQPQSNNKTKD